jgi:hypothetical protein
VPRRLLPIFTPAHNLQAQQTRKVPPGVEHYISLLSEPPHPVHQPRVDLNLYPCTWAPNCNPHVSPGPHPCQAATRDEAEAYRITFQWNSIIVMVREDSSTLVLPRLQFHPIRWHLRSLRRHDKSLMTGNSKATTSAGQKPSLQK